MNLSTQIQLGFQGFWKDENHTDSRVSRLIDALTGLQKTQLSLLLLHLFHPLSFPLSCLNVALCEQPAC